MTLEHFISQLKQGDIILHHAHDWISTPIRYFDNSDYNHCSIYDKDGFVYESVAEGVVRKKLEASIEAQNTSYVVNMRTNEIELSASITQQLIANIEQRYVNNRYGYSQLLLTGLMLKRWLDPNDFLKKLSFAFLTKVSNDLMSFLDYSNKTLLCSELVYKAYNDIAIKTKTDKMELVMPIEHSILGSSMKKISSHKKRKKHIRILKYNLKKSGINQEFIAPKNIPSTKSEFETSFEIYMNKEKALFDSLNNHNSRKLFILTKDYHNAFFNKNLITLKDNVAYFKKTNPQFAKLLQPLNIENFITPGDISRALNFEIINKHRVLENLKSDCKQCNTPN